MITVNLAYRGRDLLVMVNYHDFFYFATKDICFYLRMLFYPHFVDYSD